MIKILVADDHRLFRTGIIKIIEEEFDLVVVGEVENGEELIKAYSILRPDIILADISMPGLNGPEAVSIIKQKHPDVCALFISMYDSDIYVYNVLKCGAMGLVNKNILESELVDALRIVHGGNNYFSSEWTEERLKKILEEYEEQSDFKKLVTLSHREKQIILMINKCLTSKDIAEKLRLSKRTIDVYRSNIMSKLNLNSVNQLIKYAIDHEKELLN